MLCVYFFLNNQQDTLIIQIYSVTKMYLFQEFSLPIIRSFLLYIRHCLEVVSKTCVKLTSAECTVENSWWWAEKMPEIC